MDNNKQDNTQSLPHKQLDQFYHQWQHFDNLMHKLHRQAIIKLQHYNYPFRLFLQFMDNINKNVNRRYQSSISFIPMSDLLYLITPRFCLAHRQIKCYVNKLPKSEDNVQKCKQIVQNLNLVQYLRQNQQHNQTRILDMPNRVMHQQINHIFQNWQTQLQNHQLCDSKHIQMQINSTRNALEMYNSRMLWILQEEGISKSDQQVRSIIIQEQFPNLKLTKNQKMYGYRLKLLALLRKRAIKAEKRIMQRKMNILQLIDGEKNYINTLQNYISYIKHPIEALNILTQEESQKLFSNIQPIKKFHQLVHQQLTEKYNNHHKYQVYGDVILKKLPYFKLYVDYIYIAEKAQQLMLELQNKNQKVAQICKKFLLQKQRKATAELMQPTSRIARYDALFQEIIKKTNLDHSDYSEMKDAQKGFKKILTQVNNTVDKIMRRNRLNQLQQEFGTESQPIFKQRREYLNEFNLFMIRDDKLQPVILFCFTDFLLLCEESTRKKVKWIKIDENFYVRREEDSKTYKNMIKIHSDGFITLSTGVQQKHHQKKQQIYALLKKISKGTASQQLVYVQVLGTEQIGSTSFAKYTEYIVQVRYIELKKLLHLRFSEMNNITCRSQCHYKDSLNIKDEEQLRKTWFNNHKSKTIEDRKRNIQQILQKMFNHPLVREKPQYLLQILGLSPNFFEIARKMIHQKSASLSSQSSLKLSSRQQRQALTILCANQIKLGRDIYHDVDEKVQKLKQTCAKTNIYINTMVGDQPTVVSITEYDAIEDICNKLSKLIGLRSNRDFRLFHEIGKKQLRVLQHEQILMKIFTFPKKVQQNSSQSFIGTVTNSIKKIIVPQKHPTLVFKKYYFLPFEIQHREVKKDLTRLRLLTYQVFQEVREMKYQLSFDEYLMMAAMLIYIEQNGSLQIETDCQILHRIIPQTIFKLKNQTQEEWLVKIQPHLKRLDREIQKIIDYNQHQLKRSKIEKGNASKTALYFGHRHLCSQIVLNKIKNNPVYGSNLFYVQPYKTTYDLLSKKGHSMTYNMWLAIKVESLKLLTPTSKQTVLQVKYRDIEKINVYSQSIVFKMQIYINEQYRLDTYQSFEISQLVKYNKSLNDTLDDLSHDSVLASRAKFYKDQLTMYRITYDENQDGFKMKQYQC